MPTPVAPQRPALLARLQKLAEVVGEQKTASDGPLPADPGLYGGGASTHPTASEPNNTVSVTDGAPGKAQTADVKSTYGDTIVDATGEVKDRQEEVQPQLGITQSAVGSDPAIERNYGDTQEDPGTEHPARTDDKDATGHKYANLSLPQAAKQASAAANQILAAIANGSRVDPAVMANKTAAAAPAPVAEALTGTSAGGTAIDQLVKQAQASLQGQPAADAATAAAAGYAAAATNQQKQAAVEAEILSVYKQAYVAADIVADALDAFRAERRKLAGDGTDSESHDTNGSDSSGAGPSDGAGGSTSSPAAPPPADLAPPPAEGGGQLTPEVVAQLSAALEEAGITPEELIMALAEQGAPGMGGPPDGGPPAGGPPAGAPPMDSPAVPLDGMKLAAAVIGYRKRGGGHKVARDGSPERTFRDNAKQMFRELFGR